MWVRLPPSAFPRERRQTTDVILGVRVELDGEALLDHGDLNLSNPASASMRHLETWGPANAITSNERGSCITA